MTKSHFSQDNFGGGSGNYGGRSPYDNDYGSSSRQSRRDDDDELKKALELSKETAKKEEERRKRKQTTQAAHRSGKDDDFDIGLGFEKFATGAAGSSRANDIDDFDFNNIESGRGGGDKQEESK